MKGGGGTPQCLFCLEVLHDQVRNWKLTTSMRSSLAVTFQNYSDYLHNLLTEQFEAAAYCHDCYEKVTEIRLVQKNITQLQVRLQALAKTLELEILHKKYATEAIRDPLSSSASAEIEDISEVNPAVRECKTESNENLPDLDGKRDEDDNRRRTRRSSAKNRLNAGKPRKTQKKRSVTILAPTPKPQPRPEGVVIKAECVETVQSDSDFTASFLKLDTHDDPLSVDEYIECNYESQDNEDSNDANQETNKVFPCTYLDCNTTFPQEALRDGHVRKVHEGTKVSLKCSYCDKVYPKPAKLRIHERTHTGEAPFGCSICEKRFISNAHLKQHMGLHDDKFVCKICDKRCATQRSLDYHTNTHSGFKPFCCELCGYACGTKQTLERHQAIHHETTTNKCHVCSKNLSTEKALKNHLISVHKMGVAEFQCEQCPSSWHTERELNIHRNVVHLNLKKYECVICKKKVSSSTALKLHNQRHHVAKHERERPFQCSKCYKRFFLKRTLQNHEAIHDTARPFPCDKCRQSFPTKSYLDLHVFTIHDKRQKKRCSQAQNENMAESEGAHAPSTSCSGK